MKRLLVATSAILILLVVISIISILFGRLENPVNSLSNLGITNCDLELCVLGVHSGTQWQEAKAKLIDYINSAKDKSSSITIDQNEYKVFYWTLLDGKTNIEISSNDNFHLVTLGELMINSNKPCSITLTGEVIYFVYPQFAAGMLLPNDPNLINQTVITPLSQISDIFFSHNLCQTPATFPSSQNILLSWCGFKSISQYMQYCKKKWN